MNPNPNQDATNSPTSNPYMTLPVRAGLRMSSTGSKTGRIGSRGPQLAFAEAVRLASSSSASRDEVLALLFLPFFFLPPALAPVFALVRETAAFSAAKMSLQYWPWPSETPFSIGPIQPSLALLIVLYTVNMSYSPLIQLLPDHSTVQLICMRVALFSAHDRQYFVLTVNKLPDGTSGVCVEPLILMAFS